MIRMRRRGVGGGAVWSVGGRIKATGTNNTG